MIINRIIAPIFAALILFSCGKRDEILGDDIKGDKTLNGRLTYVDSIKGNGQEKPLVKQRVYLSYGPTDTANHIYFAVTDTMGNFSFKRLFQSEKYQVYFLGSVDGMLYSAVSDQFGPEDVQETMKLSATIDTRLQNGMFLQISDEAGQALPRAQVSVYNNLALLQADSTNEKGILKKEADDAGRIQFLNLHTGTYYLRAQLQTASGKYNVEESVTVQPTGFENKHLALTFTPNNIRTVTIRTVDEQNNPIPLIDVCVINNPLNFGAENCTGSFRQLKTGPDGAIRITDLEAQTYEFLATAVINNKSFQGRNIIQLPASGEITQNIQLKAISPKNSITVSITDENNNPIPAVPFCLFNNPLLFNAETCEGSMENAASDPSGKYIFKDLAPGNYAIFSQVVINSKTYKGRAVFSVAETGQQNVQIRLSEVLPKNQIDIQVLDSLNSPIEATLYFFTSKVLFDANDTEGAVRSEPTNKSGLLKLENQEPGLYYVRAIVSVQDINLKGTATLSVTDGTAPQKLEIIVRSQ